MTKILPGGLVLALALTPLTTQAGCAWVLWVEHYRIAPDRRPLYSHWQMLDSHGTEQGCKEQRDDMARRPIPQRKGYTIERYYICVPDTVDPREPQR